MLCCAIVFLTFFKARWGFRAEGFDESCYLEWLNKLIGRPYPQCYLATHFPGIALLWLPAAGVASLFHGFSGIPFQDWLEPFIGLTAFLLWVGSFSLMIRLYEERVLLSEKRMNPCWALLLFLAIPSLEFATRRTFTSHCGEFLLAAATLYFLYKRKYTFALIFAAWSAATRINDLPILAMVVGKLIDDKDLLSKNRARVLLSGFAMCIITAAGYVVYQMGFKVGHAGAQLGDILQKIDLHSIQLVFFQKEYSLFLFAPLWVFSFLLGFTHFKKLSWMARGGLLWMLAVLIFYIGHSGYLTYTGPQLRLFLGTYAAVACIAFELLSLNRNFFLGFTLVTVFQSLWLTGFEFAQLSPELWFQLLTGNLHQTYAAYDGSLLPLGVRKLVLEPIGLSPIAFSIYSLWNHTPVFSKFSQFAIYALNGPRLWILAASSSATMAFVFKTILFRLKSDRSVSMKPSTVPTSPQGSVELTVIIATLNEEENLKLLIPDLFKTFSGIPVEVLIVDGRSTDDTVNVAKILGCRVVQQEGETYASAMTTGIKSATGRYIVIMDADYSHTPEDALQLYQNRHRADIIINSRYTAGGHSEAPWERVLLSQLLNWIYRIVLNLPFKEISGGFRLYPREVLASFTIQSDWYEVQEELLLIPYWLGYNAIEIPYTYRNRKEGTSKTRILYFGIRLLKALIRFYFLKSKYTSSGLRLDKGANYAEHSNN